MNIITKTYNGSVLVRPDTTLNRNHEDYFVPEDLVCVGWTPVVFARICKTGKMISEDFASRYFDGIAFGVFLYPSAKSGAEQPEEYAGSFMEDSFCDFSTQLPTPFLNPDTLDCDENLFEVCSSGEKHFESRMGGIRETICKGIVQCSNHVSLRNGDYLAAELDGIRVLCRRGMDETWLQAVFCGSPVIDIKVKF